MDISQCRGPDALLQRKTPECSGVFLYRFRNLTDVEAGRVRKAGNAAHESRECPGEEGDYDSHRGIKQGVARALYLFWIARSSQILEGCNEDHDHREYHKSEEDPSDDVTE